KISVCPFQPSPHQDLRYRGELPPSTGELRGISATTRSRICTADKGSILTNGTTAPRFSWQPRLRNSCESCLATYCRGRRLDHSALRAAALAKRLASALLSRRTWEIEKSSDRANFRQIQFRE